VASELPAPQVTGSCLAGHLDDVTTILIWLLSIVDFETTSSGNLPQEMHRFFPLFFQDPDAGCVSPSALGWS